MIQAAEMIGTGLATTGLIGAGVVIGVVFGALSVARNPSTSGIVSFFSLLVSVFIILNFFYDYNALALLDILMSIPDHVAEQPNGPENPGPGEIWVVTDTEIISEPSGPENPGLGEIWVVTDIEIVSEPLTPSNS